jgi:hypothetical protein
MKLFTKLSLIFSIVIVSICHAQQPDPAKPLVPGLPDNDPNAAKVKEAAIDELRDEALEALGDTRIKDVIEQPVMTGDIMAVLYRNPLSPSRMMLSTTSLKKQIPSSGFAVAFDRV